MTLTFDGTVIVPVADPDDGERTATAIRPYLTPESMVIAVNVIEKAGGAPDKASVEQREEYAAEIFERTTAALDASAAAVETEVRYGVDVVEQIFEAAAVHEADAVAFVPREAGRFTKLLTGDVARRMVTEAAVPVVALPTDGVDEALEA